MAESRRRHRLRTRSPSVQVRLVEVEEVVEVGEALWAADLPVLCQYVLTRQMTGHHAA
jgi:hypothetical protein